MASAMEEWARRELARQDLEDKWRIAELQERSEDRRKFRAKHPWLAKLIYGKEPY